LIIGPYLADFLGRKWTIEIGCVIVVIAGIIQAAAVDVKMFTGARFLSMLHNFLNYTFEVLSISQLVWVLVSLVWLPLFSSPNWLILSSVVRLPLCTSTLSSF